jgi:hypothetical protein
LEKQVSASHIDDQKLFHGVPLALMAESTGEEDEESISDVLVEYGDWFRYRHTSD